MISEIRKDACHVLSGRTGHETMEREAVCVSKRGVTSHDRRSKAKQRKQGLPQCTYSSITPSDIAAPVYCDNT